MHCNRYWSMEMLLFKICVLCLKTCTTSSKNKIFWKFCQYSIMLPEKNCLAYDKFISFIKNLQVKQRLAEPTDWCEKLRNTNVDYRSNRSRNFSKFVFLKFSHYSQESPMLESLFNKVAGLRSATLLKKRLWHKCFPVNFAKFLRTPLLQNTSGRLVQ